MKRTAMVLKIDYVWNPCAGLPRNMLCPCFSGKKFKKCCGPDTPRIIARDDLKTWTETFAKALRGEQAW